MLKKLFLSTIKKYSADNIYNVDCWNKLESLYSQDSRHYHNLNHIHSMVSLTKQLEKQIEDYDSFLFSIFYHDAIYDTTKNDNEIQSSLLLRDHLSKTTFERIKKCMNLIESTAKHIANNDLDSSLFIDLDLSILGENWPLYQIYISNIRKEYSNFDEQTFKRGRLKVLKSILDRNNIYETEYFKDKYELQARTNISHEIEIITCGK